jgi:hypothetical protein
LGTKDPILDIDVYISTIRKLIYIFLQGAHTPKIKEKKDKKNFRKDKKNVSMVATDCIRRMGSWALHLVQCSGGSYRRAVHNYTCILMGPNYALVLPPGLVVMQDPLHHHKATL